MLLLGELDGGGHYNTEHGNSVSSLAELYRLLPLGVSPGLLPGPRRENVPPWIC
jgi:hypothetical protein